MFEVWLIQQNLKTGEIKTVNQKKINFWQQRLVVDYITLKVKDFDSNESELAKYLYGLGFNSFQLLKKFKKSIQKPILTNETNNFKVLFQIDDLHGSGSFLIFSGKNAAYFYSLMKKELIDWEIVKPVKLTRFDLYFSQKMKPSKESLVNFFHTCQEKINVTTTCELNSKGTILRIGSRRSDRCARIYQKDNSLRFEYEMKQEAIRSYSTFLMEQDFIEFEYQLTKNFILYFGKLLPLESDYTIWLASKLRLFRQTSALSFQLKTDYIKPLTIANFQDEKMLVYFFQFLIYIRDLDFEQEFLGAISYRCVSFQVRDFLKFQDPSPYTYYKFKKLKDFIESLQTNLIIQKFSDTYFQSLISIPQVKFENLKIGLIAKVWVVEDLFYYSYPFQFPNVFNGKLSKNEFSVLVHIITVFSDESLAKRFDIREFLDSYSELPNTQYKKMKEYFIKYIQLLMESNLIEDKVLILRNNQKYQVDQLTSYNISEGFILYEQLKFK